MSTIWLTLHYHPALFSIEEILPWDLTISISGEVTHHVQVHHKNAENRWTVTPETRTGWIESADIDAIENLIVEIGFENFKTNYSTTWEDQEWHTLSVVGRDRKRRVHVDGANGLAYEGVKDIQEFLRLWNFILTFAPEPKEVKRKHRRTV